MDNTLVFSVLLVIRNEEAYIENLLENVVHQDFPHSQYELIIVDGQSTDKTLQIIETYKEQYSSRIQMLSNPLQTLPTGWNLAIRHARGKYVLRLDGHTHIPKNFLSRTYEVIQRVPQATCVGGVIQSVGQGFWGEVNAYVSSHPFGVGNSKFRTTTEKWEGYVDTVPYGAYKREIFEQAGYFDENLKRNEDLAMHARIRQQGGSFFLSTSIRSTYYVRNRLSTLMEKSFADGKWGMIANKNGAGAWRLRHYIPLFMVLTGTILGCATLFSILSGYVLFLLMIIYLSLICASSWRIGRRKGIKYFLGALLSFLSLHVSRGIGSLVGLFSRAYRRNSRINENQKSRFTDIAN